MHPFLGLQFMYRGNNNTKSAALNIVYKCNKAAFFQLSVSNHD